MGFTVQTYTTQTIVSFLIYIYIFLDGKRGDFSCEHEGDGYKEQSGKICCLCNDHWQYRSSMQELMQEKKTDCLSPFKTHCLNRIKCFPS